MIVVSHIINNLKVYANGTNANTFNNIPSGYIPISAYCAFVIPANIYYRLDGILGSTRIVFKNMSSNDETLNGTVYILCKKNQNDKFHISNKM